MIFPTVVIVISILVFFVILQLPFSGTIKFFLVVAEMILVGQYLIKKHKLDSELGLILLKSKKGLKIIDSFASRPKFWTFIADVGGTISYGLMSMVLLKKNWSRGSVALGIILLSVISILVAPTAIYFLSTVLHGDELMVSSGSTELGIGGAEVLVVLLLGGFFGILLLGIIAYALIILNAVINMVVYGTDSLATMAPGGTFLLPGVNIPLVEGIAALIIIIIVHEGAHAILARIAKVPVTSSGIVLFGILPIGAFIEPDEELLKKVERGRQTRVLLAGPTANFIFSAIFFLPFLALLFALRDFGDSSLLGIAIQFLYTTFGLTFSLNFVVGTVNLLPIPFFDGYRLLELNIKQKKFVKAIMALTLVAFLLNFLPWLFK